MTERNGTHIPARVVWNCGRERGVTSLVSRETHDAFEAIARRHGLSKAALNKKLIEAVAAEPDMAARIIVGGRES